MEAGRSWESIAQTLELETEQALQAQAAVTFVLSGLGASLYLLIRNRSETELR